MKKKSRLYSFVRKLFVEFFLLCKNYSFLLAWYNLIWWLCFYIRPPYSLRISTWAIKGKTRWLDKYMIKNYSNIIEYFQQQSEEQEKEIISETIWFFWGQGEENMPPLVKACYQQLAHFNNKVVLVTNNNINEYITLNPEIFRKVKLGKISWANYSDIIRTTLLTKYGGLWVDSTVWVSGTFPFREIKQFSFFSANSHVELTKRSIRFWTSFDWNWSTWCLWTNKKNSQLMKFVSVMLQTIAVKECCWPDYVIQDYLIYFACRHFSSIRNEMKRIEEKCSPNRYKLASIMNYPFDINIYNELMNEDFVFKLSFRSPWKKYTVDGRLTFYGYILTKYT